MKYITPLRGINVSGKNVLKMAELRQFYEQLGFQNVKSYIQSGNVIFETVETSEIEIIEKIETAISEKYGYTISILIREASIYTHILGNNPFPAHNSEDLKKTYVGFFKSNS